MTGIIMVRHNLDDLPPANLVAGYGLRYHDSGDEAEWTRIQQQADYLNPITPDLFTKQFGRNPGDWSQRILYLVDDCTGRPVGTAAAWYGEAEPWEGWGRIHWVAIAPDYQGRGLSKPLLVATLRRLRELGHARAYLTTSAQRPVAVRLYERFGFRTFNERQWAG